MMRFDSKHSAWLIGGLLLLALSVLTWATESKTAQYCPDQHVTIRYKATDNSAGIKLACMAGAPVRVEEPFIQTEAATPAPETAAPDPAPVSAANPLRAPPSR